MEKQMKRTVEIGSTVTINATGVQLAMQPLFNYLQTKGITIDQSLEIIIAGAISGFLQIVWYRLRKLIGKK